LDPNADGNLLIVMDPRHNTMLTMRDTGELFAGTACDVGAEERTQGWPFLVWRRLGHRTPTHPSTANHS
jgi:hypothetical protein